jgi:hypothetical protein
VTGIRNVCNLKDCCLYIGASSVLSSDWITDLSGSVPRVPDLDPVEV